MNTELLRKATESIRDALGIKRIAGGLILGSGWGAVAEALHPVAEIPYSAIPGLGHPDIAGHEGRLRLAESAAGPQLIFQGRRHWYEGRGWDPVALPVFVCRQLGGSTLVLTNAAGALDTDLTPGSIMVIEDHINAMGTHPLVGAHDDVWGPRFPDMSAVYDARLCRHFDAAAEAEAIRLTHGVYLGTTGPAYETPAEIRAYRAMGADAVGMSTVPEAILAHSCGLRVAGISCISNAAAGLARPPLEHRDVIAELQQALPVLACLFRRFYDELEPLDIV